MSDLDLTLVSANDHLIETADVYEGRLPAKWVDRAPRIIPLEGGGQQWVLDDKSVPLWRHSAVAGMTPEQWLDSMLVTFDDIRPGCYDPQARLADMDLDRVAASAIYSSPAGVGFGGDFFSYAKDAELGIAAMRAWNDWYFETWISAAPERFIPVQVTWYLDAKVAAQEIYRNAERGFRGVTLRNPTDIGLPWLGDPSWDPLLRACQETGTVLVHHTADLPHWPKINWSISLDTVPYGYASTIFQSGAIEAVASFIWAGLDVRFPGLKVLISESGGTWLPHLLERLDWCLDYSLLHRQGWPDLDRRPIDMLRDTYTFSTLEAPTALRLAQELDFHNWVLEIDYPHMESIWPNSQSVYKRDLNGVDETFVENFTWRRATELFNFPVKMVERV
ncbi:MAG TPA: amidohydrolase family protein [Mycobacterium sp.]|uniref:amidohydrolase family protein n=1 Tax=Mycobacterium sp. TaxID=1785 RepID=UPI002BB8317D|nr:amidohydrolase family protein [Mycobacterium sp.]HME75872.1 amidohydrolase family protein [Mycobacterium sp.]